MEPHFRSGDTIIVGRVDSYTWAFPPDKPESVCEGNQYRIDNQGTTLAALLGARPGKALPPLILVPGATPSQEQKCWAEGKAEKSRPISAAMVSTVPVPRVGIAVRSTPIISCRAMVKALSPAADFLPPVRDSVFQPSPADLPPGPSSPDGLSPGGFRRSIRASQSSICCSQKS